MVIGYSGAGKSTLACELARRCGCALLHLDRVQFLPGWAERPAAEGRAVVARFLDEHDAWVIDGEYGGFHLERRLAEADLVLLLCFNRLRCFGRALGRYRRFRGSPRPDMADGCNEKFDAEFAWWILHKGRNGKRRRRYRALAARYPGKLVALKNPRQVAAFLAGFQPQNDAARNGLKK